MYNQHPDLENEVLDKNTKKRALNKASALRSRLKKKAYYENLESDLE